MSQHFPRQFGKYVLLKSLARGGMGEIYLAAAGQGAGLNKLCVIKKVITEKTEPAKLNRFVDEAKVVLRLSHANLVGTFDAGDVDGELFIAMELIEGKDLREIWNRCVRTRTRIPVDVALVVAREIARALAYVHTYGGLRLVHRDVAPPNIMLSYFGEVKLTDFGLARSILKQEHTTPGVVFGRASYLAPEQARGEVADGRTDVYSLGIVLWELLTGQPYLQLAGLDPATSLSLVRHPRAEPPSTRAPWITRELDAVVMKALAPDREQRYQSAEELRRSLSDVMARVAPRADAERVADFLRALYRDVILEEGAERERLLSETLPRFRGDPLPESDTPRTGLFPRPSDLADLADISSADVALDRVPGDDEATQVGGPSGEAAMLPLAEVPKESLHVSALRARADSQQRRAVLDQSGVDGPTKIWRRSRLKNAEGGDAAQTFVGRVIDNRYRIRQRIGEGGMGTVYAAEHVEIGKNVAVKILHRVFLREDELVERFRREARAASRVGHPHIIEVTDSGTTEEGCAYFVMELLDGVDLADVLMAEGRLEPGRAVRIAIQICQALEAAHNAGVIHRDLKPENVFLVAREGQADFVKVLDFGIARNLSGDSRPLTNPGMAMGTPEYMAPEQTQGKPADRRTDVYALGALLHEMIMGMPPFQAETQLQMLEAKRRPLESLRRLRPDLSNALDTAIARALAPDPARRPQTMKQFEYELGKIAWGRPQAVADLFGLKEEGGRAAEESSADPLGGTLSPVPLDGDALSMTPSPQPANLFPGLVDSEVLPEVEVSATPTPTDSTLAVATRTLGWPRTARRATDLQGHPSAIQTAPAQSGPLHDGFVSSSVDRSLSGTVLDDSADRRDGDIGAISHLIVNGAALEGQQLVGIDLDADPIPLSLPRRRSRAGWVAALALIGVAGGGAAWLASNGFPEAAHRWLVARRLPAPGGGTTSRAGHQGASDSQASFVAARALAPVVVPATSPRERPARQALSSSTPEDRNAARPSPPAVANTTAVAPTVPPLRGGPEIVQMSPMERARNSLASGTPDEAIAVLRPVAARGVAGAKPLLAEALVASGWNDVKLFRWANVVRKAREALTLLDPNGSSHGAHALLGEALYAYGDFASALNEFNKALAESPRDQRLKRRVIRSRRQLRPAADDSVPAEPAAEE